MVFITIILILLVFIAIFDLMGFLVNGVRPSKSLLIWYRFKNRYHLHRFNTKTYDPLLWDKTQFGEYNLEFKIISNSERKVHRFKVLVNRDGIIQEVDEGLSRNQYKKFFKFIEK